MRKLIAILLLSFVATTSNAEEISALDFCRAVAELSETIMEGRQGGLSAVDLMEMSDGNEVADVIIKGAFEVPRLSLESSKREVGKYPHI